MPYTTCHQNTYRNVILYVFLQVMKPMLLMVPQTVYKRVC